MEVKQIRERLRSSLEMQTIWRTPVLVVAIATPVLLFSALTRGGFDEHFWILAVMVLGLMVLPTAGFAIIRTIQIFRKPNHYIFCRGVLAHPRGGPTRYSIYYTVVLEDPEDGSKFFVNTRPIFLSNGIMPPTIEEYTNKTVTIAYNRETEMVVVIG